MLLSIYIKATCTHIYTRPPDIDISLTYTYLIEYCGTLEHDALHILFLIAAQNVSNVFVFMLFPIIILLTNNIHEESISGLGLGLVKP